jgi:hypothetical protein
VSQDPPHEVDDIGEDVTETIDPIDPIASGTSGTSGANGANGTEHAPPPPPPPSGAGVYLQRDFDTNVAMVNDILAVSAVEAEGQAPTEADLDADEGDSTAGDEPVTTTSVGGAPISPDLFPSARAKKRTRRSK